ncbi:hypothetical protein ACLMJK_002682 [Lecanora helva]
MHFQILISVTLFFLPAVHSASIADVIDANNALYQLVIPIDEAVVSITEHTDPNTVQQAPTNLQNLTNAIEANLNPPPAVPNSVPNQNTIGGSFGEFANQVANLMIDYYDQKPNLAGVFLLQDAIYQQIGPLNTAFQKYANFVNSTADNAADKLEITYNTGNTTLALQNATTAYAPSAQHQGLLDRIRQGTGGKA